MKTSYRVNWQAFANGEVVRWLEPVVCSCTLARIEAFGYDNKDWRAQAKNALREQEGPDFGAMSRSERDALMAKLFGI